MNKKQKKIFIGVLIVMIMFTTSVKKNAILDTSLYNGDMEDWCINPVGGDEWVFGYLNGGPTQCTDDNSMPLNNEYNGLNKMNEVPLEWELRHGCCILRTTDAYSGTYAAQIHKESKDDWYGMGLTKGVSKGQIIPAIPSEDYTLSLYYKQTTHTGRKPTISFRFYDSSGGELLREAKEFPDVASYTYHYITTNAPLGTTYMGWDIWIPVETELDLFLDEMRINEAEECVDGQSISCGTDFGICEIGTRTCASGQWGDCVGATSPEEEVCDDNLDNDCDGVIDDGCSDFNLELGLTPPAVDISEMVAKFDEINENTNEGKAYLHNFYMLPWENARAMEAYLSMYESTGDLKYLNNLIIHLDDHIENDYISWSNPPPEGQYTIDDIAGLGNIIYPFFRFARLVKEDGLTDYQAKADEYVAFARPYFEYWVNNKWKEFTLDGIPMGSYTGSNSGATTQTNPSNQYSQFALSAYELSVIDNDPSLKQIAEKQIAFFLWTWRHDTSLHGDTTYAHWGYRTYTGLPWDNSAGEWGLTSVHNEDMGYLYHDLMLISEGYKHGLGVTIDDVRKVIAAIRDNMWNQDVDEPLIISSISPYNTIGVYDDFHKWFDTDRITTFAKLAKYDESYASQTIFKTVFDKSLNGRMSTTNYQSIYYYCVNDPRYSFQSCYPHNSDDARAMPTDLMSNYASLIYSYMSMPGGVPDYVSISPVTTTQATTTQVTTTVEGATTTQFFGCYLNNQCASDEVCTNGMCVDEVTDGTNQICTLNTECPEGFVCTNSECVGEKLGGNTLIIWIGLLVLAFVKQKEIKKFLGKKKK